jgi:RNA polymerase sigma factor (sigma-70 family)
MLESYYNYINGLIVKSKAGDSDSLYELSQFYKPLLTAAVKRCLLREPKLVKYKEDINGELYLILRELVYKYDSSLSYFSYYLTKRIDFAILNHLKKAFFKQSDQQSSYEEINFSDMPENWEPIADGDPFGRIELEEMMRETLNKLSDNHKVVIDLYFFKGCNQELAAKKIGITQASFSRRLNRALVSLKKILEND